MWHVRKNRKYSSICIKSFYTLFKIHKWTIVSLVNSMNLNKSQLMIISSNLYLYLKLRQVKIFCSWKKNVGWGPEKAQNQFSGWKGRSGAWELENINFLHNAGLLSSFIPLTNPSIDKSIWSQIYNSFSDHRTAAGQMSHLLNFSKRLVGLLSEYLAEKSTHSSNNVHQSKKWSHSGSV